jgi:hypothetical protein
MGIIPAVALDLAATYAADVFTAPVPVAVATVLAVLSVIGLRILGDSLGARPVDGHPAWLRRRLLEQSPRRAVAVALLPRLPLRVPRTRTLRPATMPVVGAHRPLRGPPGNDLPSRQRGAGGAMLLC